MGKDNRCVEDDKDKETMPKRYQRPRSLTVRIKTTAPPPTDVYSPGKQQSIIDEETAAPVEAEYLFCLPGSLAISGRVTPTVIKLKCANEVSNQAGTGNGPYNSCCRITLRSSSGRRTSSSRQDEDNTPQRIANDGNPDRA